MKFKGNLEDLIKKVTNEDGTVDYSKGNELLEADVTKFIDKNVDIETIKAEANDNAKDEFIKELGIEGVTNQDTFKQHLSKLGAEDKAQEVIRLTKELESVTNNFNEYKTTASEWQNKMTQYENEKVLLSKGANQDAIDFLQFKISQMVNDEMPFEKAVEQYAKENTHYFQPIAPVRTGTTGVPNAGSNNGNDVDPIEARLIEKGRIK